MPDITWLGLTFDQLLFIFRGAGWTLVLSLLGFIGGTLIGLPLALARAKRKGGAGSCATARGPTSPWCRACRCR